MTTIRLQKIDPKLQVQFIKHFYIRNDNGLWHGFDIAYIVNYPCQ